MHRANRAAWDEAAERYERWLPEAIELIRSGGSNLFPVEEALIGDLRGRCRRAIHLQCAGGRDTLSLWNLGADEVIGIDFSPRMLELAGMLSAAVGAPARWVLADVIDAPAELDGTADLVYTGRGALIWLHDLDAWAAVICRLLAARWPAGPVRRPPRRMALRRRRRRPLGRDGIRLLRRRGGVARMGARVHRPAVDPRRRAELEVRPGMDDRGGRHRPRRRRPPARTARRTSGGLVGRPRRRPAR